MHDFLYEGMYCIRCVLEVSQLLTKKWAFVYTNGKLMSLPGEHWLIAPASSWQKLSCVPVCEWYRERWCLCRKVLTEDRRHCEGILTNELPINFSSKACWRPSKDGHWSQKPLRIWVCSTETSCLAGEPVQRDYSVLTFFWMQHVALK